MAQYTFPKGSTIEEDDSQDSIDEIGLKTTISEDSFYTSDHSSLIETWADNQRPSIKNSNDSENGVYPLEKSKEDSLQPHSTEQAQDIDYSVSGSMIVVITNRSLLYSKDDLSTVVTDSHLEFFGPKHFKAVFTILSTLLGYNLLKHPGKKRYTYSSEINETLRINVSLEPPVVNPFYFLKTFSRSYRGSKFDITLRLSFTRTSIKGMPLEQYVSPQIRFWGTLLNAGLRWKWITPSRLLFRCEELDDSSTYSADCDKSSSSPRSEDQL